MPFSFLAELQRRFTSLPSSSSIADIPAYGLQGTFGPVVAELMDTYNTAPPVDELERAKGELAQVKDIMVQNVEQILSRGERIELLVDKTDEMAHQATAFRRGARTVRRQQFWRNQKIMLLSVAVGLVSCSSSLDTRALLTYAFMPEGDSVDYTCTVLWCGSQPVRCQEPRFAMSEIFRPFMPQSPAYVPYIRRIFIEWKMYI